MNILFSIGAHNAVIALLLALLVWGFTRIYQNPPVAHLLWLLVLLKLVTPPLVGLDLGNWGSSPDVAGRQLAGAAAHPDLRQTVHDARPPHSESSAMSQSAAGMNQPSGERSNSVELSASRQSRSARLRESVASAWRAIRPALVWTWVGGAGLLAVLAGIRIVRFQRMLAGTLPASQRVQAAADELATRMGLRRSPDVRLVEGVAAPLVWRLGRRATVVFPLRLLGALDEHQTAMVLAHELAHLRRHDHWVRAIELVASVLYWWNPLVWWVRRRLHAAEEQCCDAWVAWAYPDRGHAYAQSLLMAAEMAPGRSPPLILASPFLVLRTPHTLQERIEMVLKNRSQRSATRTAVAWLAILAAVVMPAGVRGAAEGPEAAEQSQAKGPQADSRSPGEISLAAGPIQDAARQRAIAEETQRLQGSWNFDLYYSNWWPGRISNPPVGWANWRWTVEGNEIRWTGMKTDDVKLSFTLDPTKTPRQIDMTFLDGPHKGKELRGIYELYAEGACRICFADPDAKVDRPTDVSYSDLKSQTMASILKSPAEQAVVRRPAAATVAIAPADKEERGAEIDAAIARLRKLGAFVREFHPRGDPRYWAQVISTGSGATSRDDAPNFDDAALEDVERLGRGVTLHLHLRNTSVTSGGLGRLTSIGKIERLELTGPNVDDAMLKALPKLPLLDLALRSDRLTDQGIQPVAECRRLVRVSLGGALLTDTCLENLTGLAELRGVSLDKNFTQAAYDILGRVQGLTELNADATPPRLSDLMKFPNLRRLSLTGKEHNDQTALTIAETFHSLEEAYLRDTAITNAGVAHLSSLATLKVLTLDGSLVDDGMADSIRKLKQLKWLSVNRCEVSDGTLAAVSECPELWLLSLNEAKVTDEGIGHLANLKKPLTLYLSGCKLVTDASVKALSQLPDSESLHLNLQSSGITEDGARQLQRALPHAQIMWGVPPVALK